MLLARSESTVLSSDPYGNNIAGQGQVQNVTDPFSYSAGYGSVIPLAPNAVGQVVALPFTVSGYLLRIECQTAIQFSINGGANLTLSLPSPSSGGYPLTGVCLMMCNYTSLTLTNPTGGTVYVNVIVGGV